MIILFIMEFHLSYLNIWSVKTNVVKMTKNILKCTFCFFFFSEADSRHVFKLNTFLNSTKITVYSFQFTCHFWTQYSFFIRFKKFRNCRRMIIENCSVSLLWKEIHFFMALFVSEIIVAKFVIFFWSFYSIHNSLTK